MAEIELPDGMSEADVRRILAKATEKPQPSTDNLIIFQEINYGNGQMLRVYRDVFTNKRGDAKEILSIRRFYEDQGIWKPGKGVTFHDEDIDDIIEGLQRMDQWVAEHGAHRTDK